MKNKSTSEYSIAFDNLKAEVESIALRTGLNMYVTEPLFPGGGVELWCDEVFDVEGTGLLDVVEYEQGEYLLDTEGVLEYLSDIGLLSST